MDKIIEDAQRKAYNGTIPSKDMVSLNDATTFEVAVRGDDVDKGRGRPREYLY